MSYYRRPSALSYLDRSPSNPVQTRSRVQMDQAALEPVLQPRRGMMETSVAHRLATPPTRPVFHSARPPVILVDEDDEEEEFDDTCPLTTTRRGSQGARVQHSPQVSQFSRQTTGRGTSATPPLFTVAEFVPTEIHEERQVPPRSTTYEAGQLNAFSAPGTSSIFPSGQPDVQIQTQKYRFVPYQGAGIPPGAYLPAETLPLRGGGTQMAVPPISQREKFLPGPPPRGGTSLGAVPQVLQGGKIFSEPPPPQIIYRNATDTCYVSWEADIIFPHCGNFTTPARIYATKLAESFVTDFNAFHCAELFFYECDCFWNVPLSCFTVHCTCQCSESG